MAHKRLGIFLALILLLTGLASQRDALASSQEDIAYAYISSDTAYLTVGEPVTFQLMVPSDVKYLAFEYNLYYRPEGVVATRYEMIDQAQSSGRFVYEYTPTGRGVYLLEVIVSFQSHRTLTLESEPLYAYGEGDDRNPSTLPGKVKAIAALAAKQHLPTQYDKALWLHDWLTSNADYNDTSPVYSPEGVLLRNAGVCESYALAYRILLYELGIESLYLTGTSRNVAHAWNLVKIDGQWVHVDVTWDDPEGGGNEGYDYFGMNDKLLSRDHEWSNSNFIPPVANTLEHYCLLVNGASPIFVEAQLSQLLSLSLKEKEQFIEYTYLGDDKEFDVNLAIQQWMEIYSHRYFINGYQQSGSRFSGRMWLTYQNLDNYTAFINKTEFSAIMDSSLKGKTPVIRMYYVGEDESFDFERLVSDWFAGNHIIYDVIGYQINYTSHTGEITLEYRE